MARKKEPVDPGVTQEAPTAPQARDAFGRLLDQWGLPVNGPCRVVALAELGLPDPNDDPDAWEDQDGPDPLEFAAAPAPTAEPEVGHPVGTGPAVGSNPALVEPPIDDRETLPEPPLNPQTGEI